MQLELSAKQTLTVTPQMLHTMEILQMSTLELAAYCQQLAQENPMAEVELPAPVFYQSSSWKKPRPSTEQGWDPLAQIGTEGGLEESLSFHLTQQVALCSAPAQVKEGAVFLANCLDEYGYLRESLQELAPCTSLSVQVLGESLALLKTLDPPGVGAQNLKECLALQLIHRGIFGAPLDIVYHHLERLARKQYHAIGVALGLSQAQVKQAERVIQQLNPRPGAPFAQEGSIQGIAPDIMVVETKSGFAVSYIEESWPKIGMNEAYQTMYLQSGDSQVRRYLGEQRRQLQWVIQAVAQRRETVLRCAQFLVEWQTSFFQGGGPSSLRPLRLSHVAEALDLHPSTISRAIREKYLQCAAGVYPLSFFFPRSSAKAETAPAVPAVQAALSALIAQEEKSHPLSDQMLCQKLGELGFALSRRTVAKYREALGIPGTFGRKQ